MAALPTISVMRGSNFEIPLEFLQPDGSPLDITGCTVYVTAKKKADDDTSDSAAVFKSEAATHTDATHGKTSIYGVPADTSSGKPGEYLYDIEIVDTARRVTSFGTGRFNLEGEMTRRV